MPDRLTLYTIISAFWVAFLGVLGANLVVDRIIMPSHSSHEEGAEQAFAYPIEVAEAATAEGGESSGPAARPDIRPMILTAKVEDGAAVFRKCQSCHTAEAGGKNGTGPNLHNIVGAEIGDHNGFKTSESLKAIGGAWDYLKLDDYLENPKRLAPKGTMSFAGLKKPKDRADVIKFLMSNTENPPAVEVPAAAEAPATEQKAN